MIRIHRLNSIHRLHRFLQIVLSTLYFLLSTFFFSVPLEALSLEPIKLKPSLKEEFKPKIPTNAKELCPILAEPEAFVPPEEELTTMEGLSLDRDLFKEVVTDKVVVETPPPEVITLAKPGKIVDMELPFESKLNIQGRKKVRVRYGDAHYIDREIEEGEEEETPPTSLATGIEIDQELQARIHGIVKRKIHVDIDYDDTRQKFGIAYKGDSEEIVQEAAFGDLRLSLPTTEFVSYNKSLFGARVDLKLADFRLMAVGSRTKGITETKEFTGKATQQIKNIADTSFRQRKYYQLLGNTLKENRGGFLPISSLELYIDDKNVNNNTPSTIIGLTVESHDGVDSYTGHFDKQDPVDDYVVDYQTGIITLRKSIATNYVIAVKFKDKTGTWHPQNDYLMIKSDHADFPSLTKEDKRKRYEIFELKNYYSLGHTNIDLTDPDFLIEIRNLNNENKYGNRSYLWIFGLDRNDDGRIDPDYIDTELGLISFAANTPFDLRLGKYPPDGDFIDNEEDSSYRSDINRTYSSGPGGQQETLSNVNLYTTSPQTKYKIHVEYKSQVREYFLRPFIVEGSESVRVDGAKMKRDVDYLIDYESGWITFIGQVKIDEETEIKVDYEYMPFGGQYQKNLLGVRGEYRPGENFHLGSTYVYEGASTPESVPRIGSTPDSLQVINIDTQIKLLPIMENLFDFDTPLEVDLTAEVARSWKNPDLFGKAMVESMEGVETERVVSVDYKAWALGSSHSGILKYRNEAYADKAGPYNEEIGHLIDSDVEGKEKSLALRYELNTGETAAIVSPLSETTLDFSDYSFLEVWTKGVSSETIYVDLGIFNEDADGDGVLDTEDVNDDGLLNLGEDIGWEFNAGGVVVTRVGVGNGQLDSEDLDGDGKLNAIEGYFKVELNKTAGTNPETTESGWVLYSAKLEDADPEGEFKDPATGNAVEGAWELIKHIRIRIEANGSSEIYIDCIAAVGTKWEKGKVTGTPGTGSFVVTAKNSEDDPDYDDLKDDSKFKDLYRGEDLDELKEETLVLQYDLASGEAGSTRYTYKHARDYSQYKELRFWVHGDNQGENFFIRFGSDENNYFGERVKMDFNGWRLIEVDLRKSEGEWAAAGEYKGSPCMSNIKTLQLGIYGNNTKGEIWVNEIHLSGAEINEGQAYRVKVDTAWSDWLRLGWGKKVLESDFESVGMTAPVQDTTTQHWYGELSKIKWLPLSYSGSKSRIETDPDRVEDIITSDLGTKHEEKHNYGIKFLRDKWPKITTNYGTRDADVTYRGERRLEDKETFAGEISYTFELPEKILGVPFGHEFEISPKYKYIESRKLTTYPDIESKNTLLLERTHDGALDLKFSPVATLITSSSLSMREKLKREELESWSDEDYKIQSRNLKGSFGADYSALKGVRSKLDTGANFDETYTYSHGEKEEAKKTISSSAKFKFRTHLIPGEWSPSFKFIDFDHTFKLDVKANYADLDGEEDTSKTLKDVYRDYYFGQLLKGTRPEDDPEGLFPNRTSASNTRTNSFATNWYIWDPLDASTKYSIENQESQSQSSITYKDSTSYDLSFRLSLNEAFNLWKRITDSSYLLTKYRQREKIVRDTSRTISKSPSMSWQANWTQNFRTTLGVDYAQSEETKDEEINLEETTSPSLSLDYKIARPLSIKFPFVKRRLVLSRQIDINFNLGAKFKQRTETEVPKIRSNKYTAGLGLKYQIQKNLSAALGAKGEYFDDQLIEGEDYYAYEGSLELGFRF